MEQDAPTRLDPKWLDALKQNKSEQEAEPKAFSTGA